MNFFGLGKYADIDIVFDGADVKKYAEVKTEDGKKDKYLLYYDGETVSGRVNVTLLKPGSKLEHQGIRIELIGQIELYNDRGTHHDFTSLLRELAHRGDLLQNTSYPFDFPNVEKPYEVYIGSNVRLRYFLRVTIVRRISDIVKEVDIAVHTLCSYPEINSPIKMEVGIEDCLHIEFEYNKSKYHLKDVIVGKIYFLLVRIKIKHMEIAIIKRETTGSGPNTFPENETIAKYEIMDGAPVKGESIPIRVFLAGYELTPTMRDINKKFSVRYFLNLVLMDTEDRRYFKQQEITLWRKADKNRKSALSASNNPHVPSHLVGLDGEIMNQQQHRQYPQQQQQQQQQQQSQAHSYGHAHAHHHHPHQQQQQQQQQHGHPQQQDVGCTANIYDDEDIDEDEDVEDIDDRQQMISDHKINSAAAVRRGVNAAAAIGTAGPRDNEEIDDIDVDADADDERHLVVGFSRDQSEEFYQASDTVGNTPTGNSNPIMQKHPFGSPRAIINSDDKINNPSTSTAVMGLFTEESPQTELANNEIRQYFDQDIVPPPLLLDANHRQNESVSSLFDETSPQLHQSEQLPIPNEDHRDDDDDDDQQQSQHSKFIAVPPQPMARATVGANKTVQKQAIIIKDDDDDNQSSVFSNIDLNPDETIQKQSTAAAIGTAKTTTTTTAATTTTTTATATKSNNNKSSMEKKTKSKSSKQPVAVPM